MGERQVLSRLDPSLLGSGCQPQIENLSADDGPRDDLARVLVRVRRLWRHHAPRVARSAPLTDRVASPHTLNVVVSVGLGCEVGDQVRFSVAGEHSLGVRAVVGGAVVG